MAETIFPDYLVIGAGAMGMAFVDTLVSDSKATVAIIDRYARPGGHWTIAYPFVTLHQPSTCYGVSSRKLGDEQIDQVGLNKGFSELGTGDEILAYYTKVMNSTLLASGRVTYYPLHNYTSNGEFQSIATGKTIRVGPNTRIVDSTYMKVKVPAMGPPAYAVSDKVSLVTPTGVTTIDRPYGAYTVVGAGKTAIDTCLWLLAQSIDPRDISWIMPRDAWLMERANLQPLETTPNPEKQSAEAGEAIMGATTSDDMFLRLEACGQVLRIDQDIMPTMFRHAIVSKAEVEQLRRIQNIIRQGKVKRIDPDKVTLERGSYVPVPDTLFVDCTASGLADVPAVPIFNGKNITLQVVKFNQVTFSAALLAHIESTYDDDETKNHFCEQVPFCFVPTDYARTLAKSLRNRLRWLAAPKTKAWCERTRLETPILGWPPRDLNEAAMFNASIEPRVKALCEKFEEITKNDVASLAGGNSLEAKFREAVAI